MYICIKTGKESKELIKTLLAANVENEINEYERLTFIRSKLEAAGYGAFLRVYADELVIHTASADPKELTKFPLKLIDTIFSL